MTHTYLLEVELAEPTALTDGSSDAGGGHTTLDHIPGSSLLGAFVTALGVDPSDDLFARTFLSSSTRFLNAYPAADSQARTLPRPLSFRVGKLNRARVHDSISETGELVGFERLQEHFANGAKGETMKSSRGAFVAESAPAVDHAPKRIEQVHVGIDRTRRAAQDGVLFTYEAVRAGTKFHGAIETDDARVAQLLAKHATVELRIGRSRGAGYGHSTARLTKAPAGWREYSPVAATRPGNAVITLLSDYLPHLETAPAAALRAELATLAGVELAHVEVRSASTRSARGFRGVWGLPRPTRTALTKGSVLVIAGGIDTQRIAAAVAVGIGARTNEGFGRVAVNWSIHGKSTDGAQGPRTTTAQPRQPRPTTPSSPATQTAIEVRRSNRKMREFVELALRLKRVADSSHALTRLQPAQLGNLRAAVSGPMTPEQIGAWFKALSEKTAGERWRKVDVPAIASSRPRRSGLAFVWESLFGGQCSSQDGLEGTIDLVRWVSVVDTLAEQVGRADLSQAAKSQPEATLRYFIAGLVSNVSRSRNTGGESEGERKDAR